MSDNIKYMLDVVKKNKAFRQDFDRALPANFHASSDHYAMVLAKAMRENKDLLRCDPTSLFTCLLDAAALGVEPGGPLGQAYIIPYGREAKLEISYIGMLDILHRSGAVKHCKTGLICENDEYEYEEGIETKFHVKPNLKNRGAPIAAYFVAYLENGHQHVEIMSKEDTDKAKAASKSSSSHHSPWNKWEGEMMRKAVLKRAAKMLPKSLDIEATHTFYEAIKKDNQEYIDMPAPQVVETIPVIVDSSTKIVGGGAIDISGLTQPKDSDIEESENKLLLMQEIEAFCDKYDDDKYQKLLALYDLPARINDMTEGQMNLIGIILHKATTSGIDTPPMPKDGVNQKEFEAQYKKVMDI